MAIVLRKKSPRAPSIALEDAIDKACKIYDMERCHIAPIDGVAQHIGYKSAGNGATLATLASLKYYGLLERPKDGMGAVSKDVEAFRFAPNQAIKQGLIMKWLKSPAVFAELLDQYAEGLPSDATLKFELIQKGFAPTAADLCLQVFRKSVDFARYFEQTEAETTEMTGNTQSEESTNEPEDSYAPAPMVQTVAITPTSQPAAQGALSDDVDRIPIRLAGGRRAWIEIPMPFYTADKERLKKQIDLLLTNDEEDADDLL